MGIVVICVCGIDFVRRDACFNQRPQKRKICDSCKLTISHFCEYRSIFEDRFCCETFFIFYLNVFPAVIPIFAGRAPIFATAAPSSFKFDPFAPHILPDFLASIEYFSAPQLHPVRRQTILRGHAKAPPSFEGGAFASAWESIRRRSIHSPAAGRHRSSKNKSAHHPALMQNGVPNASVYAARMRL